jgi:outer membrane protein OmpA-like peptidoglycan-associated protein/uncharacterized protein YegP (UPF0339 family)
LSQKILYQQNNSKGAVMQHEDYLPSAAYEGKPAHTEKGFVAFQDEKTRLYFFALTDADGKVLLKSEGYPQITSRENGIQSVIKNRANKDFYSIKQSNDGKYYLSLRAGNHREIARSGSFDTDNEAFLLIPFTTGEKTRTMIRAAAIAPTYFESSDKKERANPKEEDNYLSVKDYAGHPNVGQQGYPNLVPFRHANGQYYFAWYDDEGNVLMRSEGYPTAAARDNGMASVAKNRELEERYGVEPKLNRYFTFLKAGNHQEIARSGAFPTELAAKSLYPSARKAAAESKIRAKAAMDAALLVSQGEEMARLKAASDAKKEADGARLKAETDAKAVADALEATRLKAETDALEATRLKAEADVKVAEVAHLQSFTDVKVADTARLQADADAKMAIEVTRLKSEADEAARLKVLADAKARVEAEVARIKAEAEAKAARLKAESDAKAAEEARLKAVADAETARLKAESDAKAAEEARLKAAADAETARLKAESDAKTAEEARLKAAADAETARLKAESDAKNVEMARLKAIADAKALDVSKVRSFANAPRTGITDDAPAAMPHDANDDDDYLTVKEYVGHTTKSGYKGLVPFKHANGKYYFVWYDDDNNVLMRSEGFPTAAARDNDMIMVDKNRDVEDRFSTMEKMNRYFTILRGGNRQEIARSGPKMSEVEAKALYPSARKLASDEKIRANRLRAEQELAAKAAVPVPMAFLATQNIVSSTGVDDDDYLSTKEYEAQTDFHPKHGGFIVFQHPRTKSYYFAVLDMNTGKVLLRSEGYPNEATRENDIEAVLRNRDIKERYIHKQLPTGSHYISLQNGNKQEIGRTPVYQTEAALWGDWAALSPNNKALGLTLPWALAGASALTSSTLPTTAIKLDVTPKKPEMEEPTTILVPKGRGIGGLHAVEIKDQPKQEPTKVIIERNAPMLGAVGLVGGLASNLPKPEIKVEMPEVTARGLGLDANLEIPKVEMPKVEIPKGEIPKVEMPKIGIPKVEIPKIITPEPSKIFAKAEVPAFAEAEVAPTTVETKPVASESRNRNWWLPIMAIALLGMGAIFYKIMENRKALNSLDNSAVTSTSTLPEVPLKPVESVTAPANGASSSKIAETPASSSTTANSIADAGNSPKPGEYGTKVIPKGASTTVAPSNGGLESKGSNAIAAKPADKTSGSGSSAKGASAPVTPKAITGTLVAKGKAAGIAPGKLNWLLFDFDKSDLRSQSMTELDKLAAILKKNAAAKAELDGHTDFKGGEDYNIRLSEHRAENAKKYLISKGIPEDRIVLKTHGKGNPYTDNATDAGRQLNRRVEIRAVDASGKAIETSVAPKSGANQK